MYKSSRVEENTIKVRQKHLVFFGKICRDRLFFAGVLTLFWTCILFVQSGFLKADTVGNFHITAKDLNLLNLKSFLDAHSPGLKYDGKIDVSADISIKNGLENISSGTFSSDKASFSSEKLLFPIDFFQLEGEFKVNIEKNFPSITGKIKSDSMKWGRLYAQNIKADYIFEGKNLIIKNGEIKIAGGSVRVNGNIDFGRKPAFFNVKALANGVDISTIAERMGYERQISGVLFSDANISGEFGKPTSIFGKTKVKIEKGDLGKVGWVGRMVTLSPVAAISKDFSLNDFEGDFNIAEGYARTDNAELKGPSIRIAVQGEAGWNKKLDFILELNSSSEILGGTSLTRAIGSIMDSFGNVLRRIKLTGTIDNPSFTILPLGIGGAVVEGLERSFEKGQQGEDLR